MRAWLRAPSLYLHAVLVGLAGRSALLLVGGYSQFPLFHVAVIGALLLADMCVSFVGLSAMVRASLASTVLRFVFIAATAIGGAVAAVQAVVLALGVLGMSGPHSFGQPLWGPGSGGGLFAMPITLASGVVLAGGYAAMALRAAWVMLVRSDDDIRRDPILRPRDDDDDPPAVPPARARRPTPVAGTAPLARRAAATGPASSPRPPAISVDDITASARDAPRARTIPPATVLATLRDAAASPRSAAGAIHAALHLAPTVDRATADALRAGVEALLDDGRTQPADPRLEMPPLEVALEARTAFATWPRSTVAVAADGSVWVLRAGEPVVGRRSLAPGEPWIQLDGTAAALRLAVHDHVWVILADGSEPILAFALDGTLVARRGSGLAWTCDVVAGGAGAWRLAFDEALRGAIDELRLDVAHRGLVLAKGLPVPPGCYALELAAGQPIAVRAPRVLPPVALAGAVDATCTHPDGGRVCLRSDRTLVHVTDDGAIVATVRLPDRDAPP